MSEYKIFETNHFLKDLDRVKKSQFKISEKLRAFVYPQLKIEPQFGPNIKKLKNWIPPTWRYRVGEWRFFYEIDKQKNIILMTAAHQRKDAY